MVKETFAAWAGAVREILRQALYMVRRFALVISAFLALVIGWLSLAPLVALPAAPGDDKLAHIIAYAALTFPVGLRQPRLFMRMLPVFVAYGGVIELVQPLVNRCGEWGDFGANMAGCFIGYALARWAQKTLA